MIAKVFEITKIKDIIFWNAQYSESRSMSDEEIKKKF